MLKWLRWLAKFDKSHRYFEYLTSPKIHLFTIFWTPHQPWQKVLIHFADPIIHTFIYFFNSVKSLHQASFRYKSFISSWRKSIMSFSDSKSFSCITLSFVLQRRSSITVMSWVIFLNFHGCSIFDLIDVQSHFLVETGLVYWFSITGLCI